MQSCQSIHAVDPESNGNVSHLQTLLVPHNSSFIHLTLVLLQPRPANTITELHCQFSPLCLKDWVVPRFIIWRLHGGRSLFPGQFMRDLWWSGCGTGRLHTRSCVCRRRCITLTIDIVKQYTNSVSNTRPAFHAVLVVFRRQILIQRENNQQCAIFLSISFNSASEYVTQSTLKQVLLCIFFSERKT